MRIVIDIDEDFYKNCNYFKDIDNVVLTALETKIANGTPLPKGHGRLIDSEELAKAIMRAWTLWEKKGEDCYIFADVITPLLVSQATIVEADKE